MRVFGIFERIPELKHLISELSIETAKDPRLNQAKLAQRRLEKILMRAVRILK